MSALEPSLSSNGMKVVLAARSEEQGQKVAEEIVAQGDKTVLPTNRAITVLFKDIAEGKAVAFCNGERIETQELYENCAAVSFDFDCEKNYKIVVEYVEQSELERLKERAKKILTVSEEKNEMKEHLYLKLCACESLEEFYKTVKNSDIKDVVKMRITENLHKEE